MWRELCLSTMSLLFLAGCSSEEPTDDIVEVCPNPYSDGARSYDRVYLTPQALGTRVRVSEEPLVVAEAEGETRILASGTSNWCGLHSDAFGLHTFVQPFAVTPGVEIVIENPLPREVLHAAGAQVLGPFARPQPTPGDRLISWPPDAPFAGSPTRAVDEDGPIVINAPEKPGHYVLTVYMNFEQTKDMFEPSARSGYWALYLRVGED